MSADPPSNSTASTAQIAETLLSLQKGLLGEVSPNLRAIVVHPGKDRVHFTAYYDGEPTEEDHVSMSCVETQLIADVPECCQVSFDVLRKDSPEPLPKEGIWAYYRKE